MNNAQIIIVKPSDKSKWKKIKHVLYGIMRFRHHDAKKLNTEDISKEMNSINLENSFNKTPIIKTNNHGGLILVQPV